MIDDLLKRPFPKENVHFRAGATNAKMNQGKADKAIALAYIDARDVMERLDEVLGCENWQDSYTETQSGRVICKLSINYPGKGWITKSDGAGDTGTEGEKGAISDAFKRAAVKFGIGRYLYSFPNKWYEYDGWKFKPNTPKNTFVPEFPPGATEREWKSNIGHRLNREAMQDVLVAFLIHLKEGDDLGLKECTDELSDTEKGYIWGLLSQNQRELARKLLMNTGEQ